MPFSSGTFSRVHDFTDDRDNGIRIQASRMDAEMDGIATGLSTALLKDGTQTATATIPFAAGISIIDNQKITLGTNSDITLQYDETTNDSLEIAANVEGAALGIVLKSDQGDDNADQHKLTIADGGVLTLGSKISGSFVDYLTHTPNSTVASSTLAVAGNLTVGGNLTLGSGAVLSEAELEQLDGITAGTVTASKAVVVDANKDIASFRNITLTGELDAGSLDISGDADIDGTLEADAMTLNGSAITTVATLSTGISNGNLPVFTSGVTDDDFLRVNGTSIEGRSASEVLSDIGASAVAGSSSIVTTGALDSGSITSGFGAIDNGTSGIRTNTFTAETSFVPDAQDGASLGTSSLQFSDLFLADGAVTAYGDDGEVTLTHVHDTGLLLSDASGVGTTKLMFGDSGTFVHQESDGTLTVESDTTLKLKGGSVLIQGADGSAMGTFSQGGTAVLSFNNSARLSAVSAGIDVVGTVAATSLDISGDIDVDGTTNLDVVDIDGAVDMASTLTVGGAFTSQGIDDNADAVALTIDGDENVAIGVTSKNSANNGSLTIGHTGMTKITGTANGNADELILIGANASANVGMSMISNNANQGIIYFGDEDDTDIGGIIYDHPTNDLVFQTNTSEKVRVKSGGDLSINDGNLVIGTSGHGIDFSAASNATNMTSELLDDYEQGTWTPTDDSDSGGSITAFGRYTKVGRLVTIHFTIRIDNTFSEHNRIGGLPFAPSQDTTISSVHGMFVMRSNNRALYGHLISGATYFQLMSSLTGTSATPSTSDGILRGIATYQAS